MQAFSRTDISRRAGDEGGFTLVELLLAMAISTLIMGAMYCAFHVQQRTQSAQEQVADMELNARLALAVLSEEFRMVGFDPNGSLTRKIRVAEPGRFEFETNVLKVENKGSVTERTWEPRTITIRLPGTIEGKDCDSDGDGVVDRSWKDWFENRPYLGRVVTPPTGGNNQPQPLARGVEAVEFVYLMGDEMKPYLSPPSGKLDDIRAVTITLLMRGTGGDPDRSLSPPSNEALQPGSVRIHGMRTTDNEGWTKLPPQDAGDNPIRRRTYYTTVQLRNANMIKL